MSTNTSTGFTPPQELRVQTDSGSYPIYLGAGLLTHTGELLMGKSPGDTLTGKSPWDDSLPTSPGDHPIEGSPWARLLIVTDTNVKPLYLDTVQNSLEEAGFTVSVFTVPAGEASKDPDTLLRLYTACSEAGISRRDALVALGGGVVGDLTGFAAATWLRGVDYIQIPTTLLAQVDSSVGGKTGIDLPQGKNLAGAFKQPAAVIADTDTLETLPARELSAGMAEVIKYALIRDPELWELLRSEEPRTPDADLIARCIRIKAAIVEADEFDHGIRQILNFGHTYGHAIEKVQGYKEWRHGEAVACGMVLALKLSERLADTSPVIRAELEQLLKAWDLPVNTALTPEELNEALRSDKKVSDGYVEEILLTAVGETLIERIPLDELDALTAQVVSFTAAEAGAAKDPKVLRFVAPGELRGSVRPPWSKSQLHRLLIAAFLTGTEDWEQLVWPDLTDDQEARLSDDIQYTRQALHNMQDWLQAAVAAEAFSESEEKVELPPAQIQCGESGTTLRLLLPIAASLGIDAVFSGLGRLPERPLAELADQLTAHGVTIEYLNELEGHHLPLRISGQLTAGEYELPGHISSQYISGLLFALPALKGPSVIRLTTPLASESYVELTREVCEAYGVRYELSRSETDCEIYDVPGDLEFIAPETIIPPEADYSQAAFWLVAQDLGSEIDVAGLNPESSQGDRGILEILDKFRKRREDPAAAAEPLEIDISDVPDIVPVLSLSAARTPGTVRLKGASRLRIKESDRLEASLMILRAVGARKAYAEDDYLIIPDNLDRFTTDSADELSCLADHRIAMALAIAAVHSDNGLTLEGSHCVTKSYPDFFDELDRLKFRTEDIQQ